MRSNFVPDARRPAQPHEHTQPAQQGEPVQLPYQGGPPGSGAPAFIQGRRYPTPYGGVQEFVPTGDEVRFPPPFSPLDTSRTESSRPLIPADSESSDDEHAPHTVPYDPLISPSRERLFYGEHPVHPEERLFVGNSGGFGPPGLYLPPHLGAQPFVSRHGPYPSPHAPSGLLAPPQLPQRRWPHVGRWVPQAPKPPRPLHQEAFVGDDLLRAYQASAVPSFFIGVLPDSVPTPASDGKNTKDLRPDLLVDALKTQVLAKSQSLVLRDLQKMSLSEPPASFNAMVDRVSQVDSSGANSLLFLSEQWKERNPGASRLMALLYLFTRYIPKPDRFNLPELLPPAWPSALDDLRAPCFHAREKRTHGGPEEKAKLLALMEARYGNR